MSKQAIAGRVAEAIKSASFIREMFERGRRMKAEFGESQVFDFSLGNPNASPPDAFFRALREVAAEHKPALHRYMPNAGFDEARAAVARFVSREYRVAVDAASVVLTSGAAGGLNVALRAICDPGDEVLLLAPFFPEYRFYVEQAGATAVVADTDDSFQPDLAAIEAAISPRTRAIILNSPNNPTGAVYNERMCAEVAALLRRCDRDERRIYLLTDDPYRRILFDREWCPTAVGAYPRSVIVSSYSKDLSIAGERAGYIAVPADMPDRALLLSALSMLNRTLGYVNMSAFMQRVIARCAEAVCDISAYRENRDLLCDGLRDAGYDFTPPAGGMFVFPRTPIADDVAFCDRLAGRRVLTVPGRGFGRAGHMRISLAVERRVIEGALPAFRAALEESLAGALPLAPGAK